MSVPPDPTADAEPPRYLSVRQLAAYLQVNEKKVYALAAEGVLPGTKATGKWLFPRELIDRWLLQSSHGGELSDRLVLVGGDDPLLQRLCSAAADELRAHALLAYSCTDTRLALALLDRGRADAAVVHWGPADESGRRHPALLQRYGHHREWTLVHLLRREQGLVLGEALAGESTLEALLGTDRRWALRAESSGTLRFFQEIAAAHGVQPGAVHEPLVCASQREAALQLRLGRADLMPGCRALAREHGLGFVPAGWEDLELVVSRRNYFRELLQQLLRRLREPAAANWARDLTGYDLGRAGTLSVPPGAPGD